MARSCGNDIWSTCSEINFQFYGYGSSCGTHQNVSISGKIIGKNSSPLRNFRGKVKVVFQMDTANTFGFFPSFSDWLSCEHHRTRDHLSRQSYPSCSHLQEKILPDE